MLISYLNTIEIKYTSKSYVLNLCWIIFLAKKIIFRDITNTKLVHILRLKLYL